MTALEAALTELAAADGTGVGLLADQAEALARHLDLLRHALNAANAMNGVHERTIARLRGQVATPTHVWIYVDGENEEMSPVDYATREIAQAHAEDAWRESVDAEYADGKLAWRRAAYDEGPDETGTDFEMLDSDGDRTTWEVRRVTVIREMPTPKAVPAGQIEGQGVLPVEPLRGFRVGDLVKITARDDEGVYGAPGLRLIGRTGTVTEIDDNPEYSIGISVEGWLGPVWCNSGEIRHAPVAQCPSCRGTGSHREPDPGDAEFESDRECLDCDGTGRVAGSAGSVETAGSAL
jgi:hypothetical protein